MTWHFNPIYLGSQQVRRDGSAQSLEGRLAAKGKFVLSLGL